MKVQYIRHLILFVSLWISPLWAADGRDPRWQEFVVGELADLPKGSVKEFLEASHYRNSYAKTIRKETRPLGPFSPDAHKVFWIPTIDVPLTPENWRFLSQLDDLPEGVRESAIVRERGGAKIRMFLHPLSLESPAFRKMAERFGGFRFEHQGMTTASTRSLIAWRTEKPKVGGEEVQLQFPRSRDRFFWPKVSILSLDVDGPRINPLKKMVRAATVTRLMDAVPESTRRKAGFDFAGEYVVGVPDGTDAGFVVRRMLPEYLGKNGAHHVEPAFSVLSAENMNRLVRGVKHPDQWVEKNVVSPLAKAVAYLLMEEGMIGENHTQNFGFPVRSDGSIGKKVLLHDADAYRTSVVLRAINGKTVEPFRGIDSPFFFMKDSTFRKTGSIGSENMNLNELAYAYLIDSHDKTTMAGAIYDWCKGIAGFLAWCTKGRAVEMVARQLARHMEPYVGRPINPMEFAFDGQDGGNVGLLRLFRERMAKLERESPYVQGRPDPRLQKALRTEYLRLDRIGLAQTLSSEIRADNTDFLLHTDGESAFITAVSKRAEHGRNAEQRAADLKGVALLSDATDPGAVKFAREVHRIAGRKVPLMEEKLVRGMPNQPIYDRSKLGGGNNRVHRRKDCPVQFGMLQGSS